MKLRGHPWLLAALLLAGGVALYVGIRAVRSRSDIPVEQLISQLPAEDALLLHIDVSGIRNTGLIGAVDNSAIVEDPDYRRFVADSGFDWKTDLDSVSLSRRSGDWYLFARGRFDWSKLQSFATGRGGRCYNGVCDSEAVTPGRRVSFYPKTRNVLGMATSQRAFAVNDLHNIKPVVAWRPPQSPAWMSFPGSYLNANEPSAPGTRLFAKALAGARRVTFHVDVRAGGMTLQLNAECASPESAQSLHSQLAGVTAEFAKYFERVGQKPSQADLSGLLLKGKFQLQGSNVSGQWPLGADFVRALLAGGA
ncbi:MAG: hypothetical protein FJW30_19355 [Acidobacteria bacterium]|nr:hypothetical protein [Acidobacteriota bacterium]